MKNWRPDGWKEQRVAFFGEGVIHTAHEEFLFEAGADAMHKADVAFLKRHHPALSYRSDGVGFITIDIQKEDWESFISEDKNR